MMAAALNVHTLWMGEISKDQVHQLMEIFSYLTKDGWKFPEWLTVLEEEVWQRDDKRAWQLLEC